MGATNVDIYEAVKAFPDRTLEQRLVSLRRAVLGRVVFTSSLGMEDQAITHAIFSQKLDIEIITLDTGRLFAEHYTLWADTEAKYSQKIIGVYPRRKAVEALVIKQGINGFFDSIDNRKACCSARKIEPLNRALTGADLWITGLRSEQTSSRGQLEFVELDQGRNIQKANPLLDWSSAQLKTYISENDIPINPLHAQGYPSIGCQPCTRTIVAGEDERAGRWWWENDIEGEAGQECGLHIGPDGKLVRTKQ